MGTSYRDPAFAAIRSKRGTGSLRERSPDVWEVGVVVGFDPGRARSIQRSFTMHGGAGLIRSLSAIWRDPSQMCRPVTAPGPVPASALTVEGEGRMTMLAEVVDAVIGIGTHRDTHEVEIADPAARPIMTMQIGNDSARFTRLLAAIAEVIPGPRVAVCIEGSRGYGIGQARALAAVGQPARRPGSPAHAG